MSHATAPAKGAPTYRAYRIGLNGRIVTSEHILADSDAQAARDARALAIVYPIELWDRARFLGRFEPQPGRPRG